MWDLRKGCQGQPGRGRRGTWWEQEGHSLRPGSSCSLTVPGTFHPKVERELWFSYATLLLMKLQGLPMARPQSPREAWCWHPRVGIHAGSGLYPPTCIADPNSITLRPTHLQLSLQTTLSSFLHLTSADSALLILSGKPWLYARGTETHPSLFSGPKPLMSPMASHSLKQVLRPAHCTDEAEAQQRG